MVLLGTGKQAAPNQGRHLCKVDNPLLCKHFVGLGVHYSASAKRGLPPTHAVLTMLVPRSLAHVHILTGWAPFSEALCLVPSFYLRYGRAVYIHVLFTVADCPISVACRRGQHNQPVVCGISAPTGQLGASLKHTLTANAIGTSGPFPRRHP